MGNSIPSRDGQFTDRPKFGARLTTEFTTEDPTPIPTLQTSTPPPMVPNVVCGGSWNSPFQFKISPGKNGTSHYVSQVLGNTFYSLSDESIAVIKPIVEQHFNIFDDGDNKSDEVVVLNKSNDELVTCDDFKRFMINQYDRRDIQYENNDYGNNGYWSIGCWMEEWTGFLPGYSAGYSIGNCTRHGSTRSTRINTDQIDPYQSTNWRW